MKVFLKQIVYLSLFITISFLSTAHAEQPQQKAPAAPQGTAGAEKGQDGESV